MRNQHGTFLRSLLWFCIAAICATVSASAAVPGAPSKLKGKVRVVDSADVEQINVTLTWSAGKGADPTGYLLYKGTNDSAGTFALLDSTTDAEYALLNVEPGTYQFYVQAFNADGTGPSSDTLSLEVKRKGGNGGNGGDDDTTLSFTTEPIRKGSIGVEYIYDADAVAADSNVAIGYSLLNGPTGMTVDSTTGEVRWTPTTEGMFMVELQATTLDSAALSVKQTWMLQVGKKKNDSDDSKKWCGTITGTVRDSAGANVTSGIVIASRVDLDSNANIPKGHLTRRAPIVDGSFTLNVQGGSYVLYVQGESFKDEWFEDAATMADATHLEVTCDDTATADFVVLMQSPSQRFTVSGMVSGAGDSTSVMAKIEFIAQDKEGFVFAGDRDWKGKARFTTHTDSTGHYSIELSNEFTYIARAIPESDSLMPQYYDGVANITEATTIVLTGDRDSINFTLDATPAADNSISGTVQDTAAIGISSQIILYQISGKNGHLDKKSARTVETDSTGSFTVDALEEGEYILFALPSDDNYVPGYYKDGEFAVRKWRDATRIMVSDSDSVATYTVLLQERAAGRGLARLKGNVEQGKGSTKRADRTVLGMDVVPGAFIVAVGPDNEVVDYTFSDATGAFQMNELGSGTYTVIADKIDFDPYVTTAELNYAERSEVAIGILMRQSAPSAVPAVAGLESSAMLYPNPASTQTTVAFTADDGAAELTIVDPKGAVVRSVQVETVQGMNEHQLQTEGLASGVYFVRVVAGARTSVVPLTIVR